jgi:hypothetical protein
MPRFSCVALAACACILAAQPASAADTCGSWRGGQYAEEQTCVNMILLPGVKPASGAMLDSIPEAYPWLFALEEGGAAPRQAIKIRKSQFSKFSRVKEILIESASGHSFKHTLSDTEETQFVSLPEPLARDEVSITVLSAYPGESQIVALRWFAIVWEEGL